ncbi:MAG: hypothetical protein Q7J85_05480 [Bacillota bacterium]|nr:hypothetical protein [Bacillota bacterium]
MTQYDYLCRKKCIFMDRLHSLDEVYTFNADVTVPSHFEQLGIHTEKVPLEAQVSILKKEVSSLKGRVTKLTAEKNSLGRLTGGKGQLPSPEGDGL